MGAVLVIGSLHGNGHVEPAGFVNRHKDAAITGHLPRHQDAAPILGVDQFHAMTHERLCWFNQEHESMFDGR